MEKSTKPANVQLAIGIMERAIAQKRPFDMRNWQDTRSQRIAKGEAVIAQNEAELITCGTAACFAGNVGVSPEWHAIGGTVDSFGAPVLLDCRDRRERLSGEDAIGYWLGIPRSDAAEICGNGPSVYMDPFHIGEMFSPFYGKTLPQITPQDVIEKLQQLQ